MPEALLALDDLAVHYMVGGAFKGGVKTLKAVDGVTLDVKPGECLGLVGESGCGKSTLALTIMGLVPPKRKSAWRKRSTPSTCAPPTPPSTRTNSPAASASASASPVR